MGVECGAKVDLKKKGSQIDYNKWFGLRQDS
jgi:hypothetical protein